MPTTWYPHPQMVACLIHFADTTINMEGRPKSASSLALTTGQSLSLTLVFMCCCDKFCQFIFHIANPRVEKKFLFAKWQQILLAQILVAYFCWRYDFTNKHNFPELGFFSPSSSEHNHKIDKFITGMTLSR